MFGRSGGLSRGRWAAATTKTMAQTFHLHALPEPFAICKLPSESPIPEWATLGETWSITRSRTELSIVCPDSMLPGDIQAERNWRSLEVDGLLPFEMVGVLSTLTGVLAEAGISLFAVSTFDTDLILVRTETFEAACVALRNSGHTIVP